MNRVWILCTAALVASSTALALDLSGQWTSGLTFTSGTASMTHIFTLHLAGPGWRLTSSFDPSSFGASDHTLVVRSGLGPVNVTAGVSFQLSSPGGAPTLARPGDRALWTADGFTFQSGFVSFDLVLGSLTLRLTLHGAPAE